MNLDVSGTLLRAVAREGLKVPLNLDYDDLQVRQSEYQSSCATVVIEPRNVVLVVVPAPLWSERIRNRTGSLDPDQVQQRPVWFPRNPVPV